MSKNLRRPTQTSPTKETITKELTSISQLLATQREQTNQLLQQALRSHPGMYEQLKTENQFGERATDQKMTEAVLHEIHIQQK